MQTEIPEEVLNKIYELFITDWAGANRAWRKLDGFIIHAHQNVLKI